ncbi:MAG: UDP-glucose 4-epimerase GalE [Hyphomonadaceae bacterium]
MTKRTKGNVLVTGGAGFIGSHTCLSLIGAGWEPVILDNFCNSSPKAIDRLSELVQRKLTAIEGDIRDTDLCRSVLTEHDCRAVIHFAGLKAVGESHEKPLEYYDSNVLGSHSLLRAMAAAAVERFIFSSSATVYGVPQSLPLTEDHPLAPTNPYGQTKLAVENLLRDVAGSGGGLQCAILRYFNPVGADISTRIGEDPRGIPNNLMPYIAQVAVGRRPHLNVMGDDYETPDGTGVRDYIHVVDLADAHVKALDRLVAHDGSFTVNLGTGTGYSVLDMVKGFEAASGKAIPYEVVERRAGDVASMYANPGLALELLGWQAKRGIEEMCRDHWNWQSSNPNGYDTPTEG